MFPSPLDYNSNFIQREMYFQESFQYYLNLLVEEKQLSSRLDLVSKHLDGVHAAYNKNHSMQGIFIAHILPNLPVDVLTNADVMNSLKLTFGITNDTILSWQEQSDMMET